MVRDGEKIVEWSVWRALSRHHKLAHVQSFDWEIYQCILLRMTASESLEVDDQHGWHIIDLDLLDSLLVVDAAIAVPSVGLRELFWSVELPETVIDAHAFTQLLALVRFRQRLVL